MINHLFLWKERGSLLILSLTSSTDKCGAALVILAIALFSRSWFSLFRIIPQTASWYEWIRRAKNPCLLPATSLSSPRLSGDAAAVPLRAEAIDAMKNHLEPLRLRSAARCASRGMSHIFSLHLLPSLTNHHI